MYRRITKIIIAGCCLLVAGMAFAQQGNYPQLDISGFKKWEYKKAEVTPQKNYFAGLTHLGGFYPTYTGGPWQERLQLRIVGQLSENLSVSYDLEQQPESPDRFDVKVKYYNNELTFGDITANFSGNEFASTSKFLNGVMLTAKDSWYDVIVVPSGKLKSQTQNLTSQKGNNTKGPYSLGHGSIVEGSEHIELNDNPLTRNVDYTIDYFEGKITFNQILTQADEFKYSYEYTNILDLFFPALSKRDFFGFQSRFTIDPEEFGKPAPKEQPLTESARETFPSTGTLESEKTEAEASGEYYLTNTPVVKFSEKLTFMGTALRSNEDYIIRYNEGRIKLLTRFLPSTEDQLVVEYTYNQTSAESETIAGIGSRGPYQFSHRSIVGDSERIEVDGKLFVRDLDYVINYELAEITFGVVIGPTSQIKAKYNYKITAFPAAAPSLFPREIKVGTTYLRESARAGSVADSQTGIDVIDKGQNIIDNDYQLYLVNRPVVPTSETAFNLVVAVDGRVLTREVDYTLPEVVLDPATGYYTPTPEATLAYVNDREDPSDGFETGTILFLNQGLITATSEISVTYAYYKSIVGTYSGTGNGTQGNYYLRNVRNIVPGTETVRVWEQGSSTTTTYTRNSSFEGDAGDTGYTINYHSDNPYLYFNNPLETDKNFEVIYQYVPPTGFVSRDLAQSVFGLDGSFKVGDVLKIETAYARSEIDRIIAKVSTSEDFSGNGNKNYTLNAPGDIIENTELIYVNDNLLNKDLDYFISYSKPGQITFYYITPATQDAISIEYDYQDPNAPPVDIRTKAGNAYRLGAETKLLDDKLTLSGTAKKIDYDFTPMGGTSIGIGSRYQDYNIKYNPDFHSFSTNYSYKENNNPLANRSNKFLRTYDHSLSTGINPNGNVRIDLGLRQYWAKDDLLTPTGTHNNDTRQESYSIGMTPKEWQRGVLTYNQKYDVKKTISVSDKERDSNNYSQTTIDYLHANGSLKLTDRITTGYDYQKSEPQTISLKHSTTEATREALSSFSRSTDTSYNFGADLTFGPLDKWTVRVNMLNHDEQTQVKEFTATDEVLSTRNETWHTDITPFSQLKGSLDHNRQESTTKLVEGTNPLTERTAGNVNYNPYSWLGLKYSGSNSESIPETGAQFKTTGNANSYTTNWNPVTQDKVQLRTAFSLSDNLQTAPSGTSESVKTNTNTFSQNYNAKLIFHPLAPLDLGLNLENYKNKNDHPTTSSRIDTETENQTITLGLTVTPNTTWKLNSSYSEKTTRVIKDLNVSPSSRKKTVLDNKVTYKVVDWGTVVYNRQDERNGGEVQSGSVADLNIEKTTNTYSLNVNIPTDNPVLTSFLFIASLKTVDYKNLNNSGDNFNAQLMTFEGSLNF
jgi:hypothetical protein